MKSTLAVLVCTLLFVPAVAETRTWLVRQGGSGDCTTVQACVDSATVGDTVLVGPGTYYEHLVVSKAAGGVHIISELGPEHTVIDGSASGRVVRIDSAGVGTSLEGFTIQNGLLVSTFDPGAGICCTHSSVLIQGNIISHNTCYGDGEVAGVYCEGGAATIRGNLIIRNSSQASYGGVVLFRDASTVEGNTIACNSGSLVGGIYAVESSATIVRTIVAHNEGFGILCVSGPPDPTLVCNDFWENTAGNYYGCGPGEGDISLNPQFCDPSEDNFLISESSPCVNWPGCGLIGALGVGCGSIGVKEQSQTTWGRIKVLFR